MAIKHDAKVGFLIKLEYGQQKDNMCVVQLVATTNYIAIFCAPQQIKKHNERICKICKHVVLFIFIAKFANRQLLETHIVPLSYHIVKNHLIVKY